MTDEENVKKQVTFEDLLYMQLSGGYLFDESWSDNRLNYLEYNLKNALLTEQERQFIIHCKELEEKRLLVKYEFEDIRLKSLGVAKE